jgi:NAD(P)-dependent dehydrogenase (short-subunit alcohol dehydrogenase family)
VAHKTWFITGTSRGFGRLWATAALERGDKVAAVARDSGSLADLVEKYQDAVLPIALDVTHRETGRDAVNAAQEHFGRLDVVVNNAAIGLFGAVEETSEAEAREQFDTSFFGSLWVTQAALPLLREQGGGHILQVSSTLGVTTLPYLGALQRHQVGGRRTSPDAGLGSGGVRDQDDAHRARPVRNRLGWVSAPHDAAAGV